MGSGASADDMQMMKDLGNLIREGNSTPQPKVGEAPRASKPSAVKMPERKAPEFTLSETPAELQLVLAVPGLSSMQGVNLDVTERRASMDFPSAVGFKPLQVELPSEFQPNTVRAKFSKKNQQITV